MQVKETWDFFPIYVAVALYVLLYLISYVSEDLPPQEPPPCVFVILTAKIDTG